MPITIKKNLRKILAGILSLCMVVAIANMSTVVTSAATSSNSNGYSLDLGTAIWTDSTHTKFNYSHAKIKNVSEKLTLLTVTVENGSFKQPGGYDEPDLTDIAGTSKTWIFNNGKDVETVQNFIRSIEFTPNSNTKMNVNITVDGNQTTGFENMPPEAKLTQWTNGHYYLYYNNNNKYSWSQAYNLAKKFSLGGREGYLVTLTSKEELNYCLNISTGTIWTGGTQLRSDNNDQKISDRESINNLYYGSKMKKMLNNSEEYLYCNDVVTEYYWACGPEANNQISSENGFWIRSGQSSNNRSMMSPNASRRPKDRLQNTTFDSLIYDGRNLRESCVTVVLQDKLMNDIPEGNYTDVWADNGRWAPNGIIVEFGGYTEINKDDPGGRDTSKTAEDKQISVEPKVVEAQVNGIDYAPLSKALEDAQNGDTIKIVKDQVTVANDATLKQGVTLEDRTGQTFKATTNSVIDVNTNGKMTLKDGQVEASARASLSVEQNGQAYDVTVPNSKTTVVAGENGSDFYVRPEHDGTVKIGDVSYTYTHKDGNTQTQIYIPDGMYQNPDVSKAEVAVGKTGTVKIDDNQTVEVKQASATEKVTVERKNDTVEATVPANATVDAFGHTGITSTSGTLKVKPGKDGGRTTVKVTGTDTFTADGHPYTGLKEGDVIPLGKYNVTLSIGNNITSSNTTTEYYYNDKYDTTLTPSPNYDLAKKDVNVRMGGNDVSDKSTKQNGDSVDVSLTVTDDIEINADSKRQKTVITFDTEGNGTYTVTNAAGENVEVNDNKVEVNRNDAVTVTFTPKAKTRAVGDSFAILTKLSLDDTPVFNQAVLDWNSKGYTYTFTPNKAKYTVKANYTDSHLVNVNVTGGTVTGLDKYVGATTNNDSVKSVIVPNDTSVALNFEAGTAVNTNHARLTVNGTKVKKFNGKSYTVKVDEPKEVVVAYTTQPEVTVSVENGTFDQDASDNLWTQVADGYQTTVENDDATKLVFEANKGCGVDSFMINGQSVKITKNADGKYEYTLENVTAATSVKLVFAKEYKVTFKDQNDVEVGSNTVVENHTISKKEFENAKANLKADKGYTFFGWKDVNGKIYTEETAVTGDTVLKAYFKKGVDKGESKDNQTGLNAIIGANGFTIHVDNVKNLTSDNAKDRAEAEAISSKGTMVAKENIKVTGLAELKKATKAGTYELTFEAEDAKVTVKVNVQDMTPAVTGKTASTVTIKGEPNTEYTVKNPDGSEVLDKNGQPIKGTTDANGKVTFVGLEKGKDYTITSEESGSVKTGTSAVDAEDIANSFRENEKDKAKVTGEGLNEKAENSKVDVVVDENGNYKVILKEDINGTVTVPDTWGDVTVDLNGNTIKGNDATDKEAAKPGLDFVKDDSSKGNGTNLVIKDTSKDGTGTIAGGNGSNRYPNGAAGIKGNKDASTPTVEVAKPVKVIGGNGATGEDGNGGNGGSGIEGNIDTIINGGTVIGGNGGNGADKDNGNGGTGGNGGNGIDSDNKNVTVKDGEVTGGNGGNGGNSSEGDGGNGGTGGNGITGSKETEISGGNISGGDGGNGGSTGNGNGGTGGSGGNGITDSKDTNISGGEINGGNGGDGGNSDKGNGGNGGNGGDGVDNGKNPGTITGGDINGGNGGNGGNTNDGTGGSGGNGGNGIDGTGNTIDENVKPDDGTGGKEGQSGQNSTDNSSKPQVKPNATVKSNNNAKQGKTKTGDESNTMLYVEIAALSFVGLMILFLSKKREEMKN